MGESIKTYQTIIFIRSYHIAQVRAVNVEEAIDKFRRDFEAIDIKGEIYERASWDIYDTDDIEEIKPEPLQTFDGGCDQ